MSNLEQFNPLQQVKSWVNSVVAEDTLPTEEILGRSSTVGIYGGTLENIEGKLVWTATPVSWADRTGDKVLRTFDEHTMKSPGQMLVRHPRWFFKQLYPGPIRYRGTHDQIAENAERLGLGELYKRHPRGIEITSPSIMTSGIYLQDIFRQYILDDPNLNAIDRFSAVEATGRFIHEIHDQYGAVGEILTNDICFQSSEEDQVSNPVLNIPDIVWNESKDVSDRAKKGVDLLDIMANMSFEELRRSNNLNSVVDNLVLLLKNYADTDIIKTASSFAKRGRLTLPEENIQYGEDMFAMHNSARLMIPDNANVAAIRERIIAVCDITKTWLESQEGIMPE